MSWRCPVGKRPLAPDRAIRPLLCNPELGKKRPLGAIRATSPPPTSKKTPSHLGSCRGLSIDRPKNALSSEFVPASGFRGTGGAERASSWQRFRPQGEFSASPIARKRPLASIRATKSAGCHKSRREGVFRLVQTDALARIRVGGRFPAGRRRCAPRTGGANTS